MNLANAPPPPPTLTGLAEQVRELQHQSTTILFLGAVNMVMNVLTIAIGFLVAL